MPITTWSTWHTLLPWSEHYKRGSQEAASWPQPQQGLRTGRCYTAAPAHCCRWDLRIHDSSLSSLLQERNTPQRLENCLCHTSLQKRWTLQTGKLRAYLPYLYCLQVAGTYCYQPHYGSLWEAWRPMSGATWLPVRTILWDTAARLRGRDYWSLGEGMPGRHRRAWFLQGLRQGQPRAACPQVEALRSRRTYRRLDWGLPLRATAGGAGGGSHFRVCPGGVWSPSGLRPGPVPLSHLYKWPTQQYEDTSLLICWWHHV